MPLGKQFQNALGVGNKMQTIVHARITGWLIAEDQQRKPLVCLADQGHDLLSWSGKCYPDHLDIKR